MSETKIAERWAERYANLWRTGAKTEKQLIEEISSAEDHVRQLREAVRRLMLVLPDYHSEVEAMELARTTLSDTEPKP